MKPTQGTRIISSPSLTGVFDVVDVLPLAERVAVLAPARPRPLADVHQVPFGWRDRVIKVQTTRALQGQDWSGFCFCSKGYFTHGFFRRLGSKSLSRLKLGSQPSITVIRFLRF